MYSLFGLLLLSVFATCDIQKISNSIIRNGSQIWTFQQVNPGWNISVAHRLHGSKSSKVYPSVYNNYHHQQIPIDSTPDINYMSDGTFNLYFTETCLQWNITGTCISVATAKKLTEEESIFEHRRALIGSGWSEARVSHPTLHQASDGTLTLYYYNSSLYTTYGQTLSIKLTPNGLSPADECQPGHC